jgi:hypothetical protein
MNNAVLTKRNTEGKALRACAASPPTKLPILEGSNFSWSTAARFLIDDKARITQLLPVADTPSGARRSRF